MSSADEHSQSDSEVSHDEDSSDSDPGPGQPSNGPETGMSNGNKEPQKKPDPRIPASDDPAYSPMLRSLLASGPSSLPLVITSPLQASTSRAIFIPPGDAAGTSSTSVGHAPASVPGIAPAPGASTSTASIVPGAGETSSTDVGSASETFPVPEDAGASVSAPEDVLQASTSSASSNPEAGEISKAEENAAVEIPLPVVGATGRGIGSEAEGSNIPEMMPTPEAVAESNPGISQIEGIPEIRPAPEVKEGNVPGAVPSAASMPIVETGSCVSETGAEAARSPDLETVPLKEVVALANLPASESMEAGIPEAVQNIDADVPEILQSTVAHAPSATLPADVEKTPKDEHASKKVVEASVAQDLVPEIAEKSDQLPEPTETTEIAEPEKCTTVQEESSQIIKECAQAPEQKPVAKKESQALELAEESNETSNPKTSEATAVESGQASKLSVEASQSKESRPDSSEKYSQLRAALEAKTTLKPATIGSGSGQTLRPTEETREASKPTEVTIEVSKPTEDAREVSKPQMSAATASEPSRVTEQMDTSEPSESDLTPESKLEPGNIDAKSEKRSPKRRAGVLQEHAKPVDDANDTPSARRSRRIAQRTHSESPIPKKECRTVRSTTSERVPSEEKLGVRTRSRNVGSTSSNSEIEGSGDEVRAKRASRKDSKK